MSKLRTSVLAPGSVQSEIRAMSVLAEQAGGINMAQGICDTDLPLPVAQGAHQAIEAGHNIYTRLDGIAPLREAIAAKLHSFNGIPADPHTEVLVTNGATGALYAAALALLDPGDQVLLLEPFYGYHWSTLAALRVEPVAVPLTAPDWSLDLHALHRAVTPRTKAILVNTPSNPSGKVFTRAELQALADFAQQHDLLVLTDEIYEHFTFGTAEHLSLATLPGMAARTITISGLSKTFSITGWRIGYLHAPAQWVPAIGYFHDLTYVCAPAPLQWGAAAGLQQLAGTQFYTRMRTDYRRKRDLLCAALAEAGLPPSVPDGAYYVLAQATRLPGATARDKARHLLAATGVAAVAGSAFFAPRAVGPNPGELLLRFCFGKRDEDLAAAAERLRGL